MKYYIDLTDKRNRHLFRLLRLETLKVYELILGRESACDGLPWEKSLPFEGENCAVIFSPAKKLSADEANALPEGCKLFCGAVTNEIAEIFCLKDITHINFMLDEAFAYSNAMLTAEGVLAKLIASTERSIFENNILIFGCGRCGKSIAVLFKRLGLNFSLVSFDRSKCGSCKLFADKCYFKTEYVLDLHKFDVLINTVPARIIDDNTINKIRKDAAFIEVASVDCLDKSKAAFNYIPAPALPLHYCCESAARLMLTRIKEQIPEV